MDCQWTVFAKLIMIPVLVLLSVTNGIWQILASPDVASLDDGATNCRVVSMVTSGTFDQYYALADLGNRLSERLLVNVSVEVTVRNRQEELAVLLSSEDRSHQYPDFAHSYEMRLTNVYAVLYRDTVKLQAYHSPLEKLFPGEQFRVRFLIARDGQLTVLANDDLTRPLLSVIDPLPPLETRYLSFASRMNAYPIRYALGCGLPLLDSDTSTESSASSTPVDNSPIECPVCQECVKQRCQVVVRACADNNRDSPDGALTRDEQEQRYYFYFNLYLQKNKTKTLGQASSNRSP